jgi:T5SS/PEP-CTERM-associated repeat protein
LLTLWLALVCPAWGEDFTVQTVDGVYTNAGHTFVLGNSGSSNMLTILRGGRLDCTNGIVGATPGAEGNLAWVTDAGSLWENTAALYLGHSSSANQLVISNGARVNGAFTVLGWTASSTRNSALLTGNGTLWTCYGGLRIGGVSDSNEVRIVGGARLFSAGAASVGYTAPASRNALWVSGPGSWLAHSGAFSVGSYGAAGNQAVVSAGAAIFAATGTIGNGPDNRMWVSDPGTVFQTDRLLYVGREGTNNQLIVTNGARVANQSASLSGQGNLAVVSGPGSVWDTGSSRAQLVVGATGTDNRLLIGPGGRVNSYDGYVSSSSNAVILTGPGAWWNLFDLLFVGEEFGRGNQLTLADGGQTVCFQMFLAGDNGAATVTGPGSLLSVSDLLSLGGDSGLGNRLTISNGGRVSSRLGSIGGGAAPFDPHGRNVTNTAVITGAGSVWSNSADLVVGSTGARSQLVLSDGGQAVCSNAYLGYYGASSDNLAWIADSNTLWQSRADVFVGYQSWRNRLVITNGGRVTSANGWVGRRGVRENLAVVTDAGSAWQLPGNLVVGNGGGDSRLVVTRGGQVQCGALLLDAPNDAAPLTANSVVITGTHSLLQAAGASTVGVSSSVNELRVELGGTFIAGNLTVGSANTLNNGVTIAGGLLLVTNSSGTGSLDLRRAQAIVNGGTVLLDRLLAGAGSSFSFPAGQVTVQRAASVTDAWPFTVGATNGVAELRLLSGTHVFAGGLVVASNSVLAAAGTLRGSLTHAGRLRIGSATESLTVAGDLGLGSNAEVAFDIAGPARGTQHDFLRVSNAVVFDGLLRLALVGGYIQASNAVLTLMEFGSATGSFQNAPPGARLTIEGSVVTAEVDYSGLALRLLNFENAAPATNQIDPAWELYYFGHSPLTEAEKQEDPDQDGSNNLEEYLASTDPLDAESVLRIVRLERRAGTGIALQFRCVVGRAYAIAWSADLVSWTEVAAPVLTQPAPGLCEWLDDGGHAGGSRFYRVAVW